MKNSSVEKGMDYSTATGGSRANISVVKRSSGVTSETRNERNSYNIISDANYID